MNIQSLSRAFRKSLSEWSRHDATRIGAALAFYTLVSLAPLVVIITTIIGVVYGHAGAQARLPEEVQQMIGPEGAQAVKSLIEQGAKEQASHPAPGTLAAALGLLTLLFGASGVFVELRSGLNTMWDIPQPVNGGWFSDLIKERLFTFGMVLAVGFLLLVSLVVQTALVAFGTYFEAVIPLAPITVDLMNLVISFVAATFLFGMIFKYVPQAKVEWHCVWPGAAMTAFLFTAGRFVIGFYLAKVAVGSAYGAAGSVVVVVVWIYYSSLIFLFGAEFTHVLISGETQIPAVSNWGNPHVTK